MKRTSDQRGDVSSTFFIFITLNKVTIMTTIDKINKMVDEVVSLIETGYTLQEVTKKTYQDRESGKDMIYFGWLTKGVCLAPNPTKKQEEYYKFFRETADGMRSLPKYVLYIYNDRVEFLKTEKVDGEVIRTSLRSVTTISK